MSAPRQVLLIRLTLCCLLAGLSWPTAGHGLDYDRNDVRARELGVNTLIAPINGAPLGLLVHGTARRNKRHLYLAMELQLGALVDHHPWVQLGGAVGGETADDAWTRLRGYGEVGTALIYANTKVADTLAFFGELGVRYQLRAFERPHLQVTGGLRGMTNFSHLGLLAQVGLAWTFD